MNWKITAAVIATLLLGSPLSFAQDKPDKPTTQTVDPTARTTTARKSYPS